MLLQLYILATVSSSPAWTCDEDKSELPLCASSRGSLSLKRTCSDLAGPGEEIFPRLSQHLPSLLGKTIFKFFWETSWVLWGKGRDEHPRCAIKGLEQESSLALPLFSLKTQELPQGHPLRVELWKEGALPGKEGGSNCHSLSTSSCSGLCQFWVSNCLWLTLQVTWSWPSWHVRHWHCKHKLRNQVRLLFVFCSLVEAMGAY